MIYFTVKNVLLPLPDELIPNYTCTVAQQNGVFVHRQVYHAACFVFVTNTSRVKMHSVIVTVN